MNFYNLHIEFKSSKEVKDKFDDIDVEEDDDYDKHIDRYCIDTSKIHSVMEYTDLNSNGRDHQDNNKEDIWIHWGNLHLNRNFDNKWKYWWDNIKMVNSQSSISFLSSDEISGFDFSNFSQLRIPALNQQLYKLIKSLNHKENECIDIYWL